MGQIIHNPGCEPGEKEGNKNQRWRRMSKRKTMLMPAQWNKKSD
jgi:hypothetical protein